MLNGSARREFVYKNTEIKIAFEKGISGETGFAAKIIGIGIIPILLIIMISISIKKENQLAKIQNHHI